MNCKQGELAMILDNRWGHGGLLVIFQALRESGNLGNPSDPVWIVDGPVDTPFGKLSFPDRHLRPIRDPGKDAVDETLSWLPVPTAPTAKPMERQPA